MLGEVLWQDWIELFAGNPQGLWWDSLSPTPLCGWHLLMVVAKEKCGLLEEVAEEWWGLGRLRCRVVVQGQRPIGGPVRWLASPASLWVLAPDLE